MTPGVTEEKRNNIGKSRFENPCQLSEESRIVFVMPTSTPPKIHFIFYNITFNHPSLTPKYLIKWSADK